MCYTVYQTAEVEEEERHVEFLACVEVIKGGQSSGGRCALERRWSEMCLEAGGQLVADRGVRCGRASIWMRA